MKCMTMEYHENSVSSGWAPEPGTKFAQKKERWLPGQKNKTEQMKKKKNKRRNLSAPISGSQI